MKKFLALMLAVIMLACAVAGCGEKETPTTESTTTATTVATTTTTEETVATTTTEATTTTTETTTEATTTTETTTEPPIVVPDVPKPLIHITFDELTDDLIFADDSGNGYDAKANKKLKLTEGKFGKAVSLESVNQFVEIADNEAFKFSKNDSFTIDVWFKWSGKKAGTNWPCIIQKGLVQSKNLYKYAGFWINSSDSKLNLGVTSSNSQSQYSNNPVSNAIDTEWHHAVAVQDAEAGTISVYFDGKLAVKLPAIDASSAGCPFTIGYNGSDGQFVGAIDELNIYDFALDMGEASKSVDDMLFKTYNYTSETGKTVSLPYRLFLPKGYEESKAAEYPVLLFLHGYGEIGSDNTKQIRVLGGSNALLDKLVSDGSCVIIAPQCNDPAEYNWVPINHEWKTGSRELTANPTITLEAATALLKEYIAEGKIDTKRVYVSGISMGGYGTWEIIARNPELFAAAVPLCGAGIPSKAAELKDMAIWAFHGLADPTVPAKGTQDMQQAIKAAGGTKFKATYFEGVGHNIWAQAYGTPGLVEWILSQSK